MEKRRQIKIFSIVSLVFAILAMTIGFAAFSATLNISSSAKVTPSANDFKIALYGFVGNGLEDLKNYNGHMSTNSARILSSLAGGELVFIDLYAMINGLNISNISIPLSQPNDAGGFFVKIVNEGKYDAYFDTTQLENFSLEPTCVVADESDATLSLVQSACSYIYMETNFVDKESFFAFANYGANSDEFLIAAQDDCFASKYGVCKLEKGASLYMLFSIRYGYRIDGDTPLADGAFVANFDPITLTFTSNDTSTNGSLEE